MAEWQAVRLGEIVKTNQSTYSPKENWQFVNYLDTGNITMNKIDEIQNINTAKDKLPSRARRKVKTNSIIYSTVRPNQLHYGIIKKQPDNFLVSTGFTVIDVNYDKAVPDFIYYALTKQEVTEQLQAIAEQSVSAYPSLKPSDIENLELMLPDKKTQERIVAILRSIDEKIKENNAINNNLEQQAMALFKSWFIDFEPFDGKVPKTWINGVLGDFVEIKRGGSPRPIQNFLSDSGFHWLKISDATGISSPFINEIKEYIIEAGLKKTVYLKSGSLVLSNSATPGLPKILDIDTCIHDGWLYFPSSKFSNEYLYLYFKHIRDNLIALGNGSVFTNLKTDILKNYPTYLPTEDVLKKFDGLVQPIFSMILSKTREIKRLAEIRDTLLPKLMSGELDVSYIEL
ncbi:MAG TPA: restriction endonuclease subunit S [Ruminococcus bromii]|nr:restriction endonuclease subunit S [Ruminococcus bromii]HJI87477.1 restriction endonuclease subunit S [Ruminococcus bromii]